MNSCQVHNLIDFKLAEEKNRIKSDRIEVKDEVQEAMDEAAADTAANGTDTEDDMEDYM